MKRIFLTFCLGLFCSLSSCRAQSDQIIVKYFKSTRVLSFEQTLFAPDELIELCDDSVGRQIFLNTIKMTNKMLASSTTEEAKEKRVLLTLINNNIKASKLRASKSIESKNFIQEYLNQYIIDFEVDDEFVANRFNAESEVSFCNRCISMYIFFVYDPMLYLRVRSKKDGFQTSKVHFPVAYILQDCNTPIEITKRIQKGLLDLIMGIGEPTISKIRTEIELCDLNNRCD